ncbi:MAG: 50S ribosomal protein L11 methyltransferase [Muribaculaceae bacterium]|nr:50S ribosomal protein L11 methyltransferase [Muribaculaceae bacterium]
MNDYIEVRFELSPCDEIATDVLAALLCEYDYESFVPDETGLTAYIKKELYKEEVLTQVVSDFPLENKIRYAHEIIEGQDWNSEWEKNYFKPIVVKDKCVIHSSFHKDIPQLQYDIVIDPKMAFGTGHHATTSLIIEQLLEMEMEGKSVIDMGTGTGILAILSHMRGAKNISAIEIDPVAHANAIENLKINGADIVNLILGDASSLSNLSSVDVFIANINRNIITQDIESYVCALNRGGIMLLSGFYEEDIPVIMKVAEPLGLKYVTHKVKDKWSCLKLSK